MSDKSDMAKALDRALKIIGGTTKAARAVGCKPQAVDQWEIVPPGRVLAIEAATDGKVSRYELRPDIYGEAPDLVSQ